MRGRKPKPTILKVISGNPGRRPINEDEPEPHGDLIDPPEWMDEDQREGWRYAIEHAPHGLLRMLDRSVFAAWVVAESVHRKASRMLSSSGLLVRGEKKIEPSPLLGIINKQATIMIKAAEQLGFTPSSRSRIKIDGKKKPESRFREL